MKAGGGCSGRPCLTLASASTFRNQVSLGSAHSAGSNFPPYSQHKGCNPKVGAHSFVKLVMGPVEPIVSSRCRAFLLRLAHPHSHPEIGTWGDGHWERFGVSRCHISNPCCPRNEFRHRDRLNEALHNHIHLLAKDSACSCRPITHPELLPRLASAIGE